MGTHLRTQSKYKNTHTHTHIHIHTHMNTNEQHAICRCVVANSRETSSFVLKDGLQNSEFDK